MEDKIYVMNELMDDLMSACNCLYDNLQNLLRDSFRTPLSTSNSQPILPTLMTSPIDIPKSKSKSTTKSPLPQTPEVAKSLKPSFHWLMETIRSPKMLGDLQYNNGNTKIITPNGVITKEENRNGTWVHPNLENKLGLGPTPNNDEKQPVSDAIADFKHLSQKLKACSEISTVLHAKHPRFSH